MKTNETITLINGNGQPYELGVPEIVILDVFNDVAFKHLRDNTGIDFQIEGRTMKGNPTEFKQVAAIFATYNFITCFSNNSSYNDTIFLRPANISSQHFNDNIYAETNRGKELISRRG